MRRLSIAKMFFFLNISKTKCYPMIFHQSKSGFLPGRRTLPIFRNVLCKQFVCENPNEKTILAWCIWILVLIKHLRRLHNDRIN